MKCNFLIFFLKFSFTFFYYFQKKFQFNLFRNLFHFSTCFIHDSILIYDIYNMAQESVFGEDALEMALRGTRYQTEMTRLQFAALANAKKSNIQRLIQGQAKGSINWCSIANKFLTPSAATKISSPTPLRPDAQPFVPMSPSPTPSSASTSPVPPISTTIDTKEHKKHKKHNPPHQPPFDMKLLEPYLVHSDTILDMLRSGIGSVTGETGSGKTTSVIATLAKWRYERKDWNDKDKGQCYVCIPGNKGTGMMYEFLKDKAPIGLHFADKKHAERPYLPTRLVTTKVARNWLIENWKRKSLNDSVFVIDEAHHSGEETTSMCFCFVRVVLMTLFVSSCVCVTVCV